MKNKNRPLRISFANVGKGWITLQLNLPEKSVKIWLSGAFDPLPEIFKWLEDICVGDLPSEIDIDQEGGLITLAASVLTRDAQDSFLLKIFNEQTGQLLAKSELRKYDFVMTFINSFEKLVIKRNDKKWCGYGLDELPYDNLKQYFNHE